MTGNVAPAKKAAKKTRAADQGDDASAARVKRHKSSMEEQAAEKMAALYWDLNCHAGFQQIVTAGNPSPEDISNYDIMKQNTSIFINQTIIEGKSGPAPGTRVVGIELNRQENPYILVVQHWKLNVSE
ncbi:hypothetical protein N7490_003772 [Penicillium lividum]|nr:hypothetical protein N7490_003772 [Penicillium lividum]